MNDVPITIHVPPRVGLGPELFIPSSFKGGELVEKRCAHAIIEVKSLAESPDYVTIKGIASTPTPDRVGDIVEPMGARFKTPMPLLWQHEHNAPVGEVTFAKPSKTGIPFEARLPLVKEAGRLKDRIDEAIHSLKYGLVAAVSIGFKPVKDAIERLDDGGYRFKIWDWMELSLVTIPAQPEAVITGIKSLDDELRKRAELGRNAKQQVVRLNTPGASGTQSRSAEMNMKETIASFEAKRAATAAICDNLLNEAEGRTLDDDEQAKYDEAKADVARIDKHLTTLREHESIATLKKVSKEEGEDPDKGSAARTIKAGEGVIRANSNIPKHMPFVRYSMALAAAKGDVDKARRFAKNWGWDTSTPEVGTVLDFAVQRGDSKLSSSIFATKAAVAAGTTTDTTWAAPLVQYTNMASEFIEFLRPATILGRLQGVRRVPFYVRIPRQTAGVTGGFVGEGAPKPVNKLDFDSLTMEPFKAAVIVVITQELGKFSSPDAETLIANDMRNGIAEFLDKRLIDPQYTGNSSSPQSLTNGVTQVVGPSSPTTALTDAAVESMFSPYLSANMSLQNAVFLMSPTVALSLSMKRDTNDRPLYPGLTMNGGTWYGIPVIVSNSVALGGSPSEALIVLIDQSSILLAQEGMDIDMSTEASVQLNDAPSTGAQSLVSLWQNNLLGIRAEQFVNWKKARSQAVQVMQYNISPAAV